jgi:long-chain acyl-CoA synthetase
MNNINELIDIATKKYHNLTLFNYENKSSISYSQFSNELANAHAYFLEKFNNRNFNFSIIAPNCPNYLYILFAMLKTKNIAVNLNPNLNNNEIVDRLDLSKCKILFTTTDFYKKFSNEITKTKLERIYILDENCINFKILDVIYLQEISLSKENQTNIAFLQFTGGTTGVNKAAVITHQNILSNLQQIHLHFSNYIDTSEIIVLIAFPFYHIFSIVFNFLFFLEHGGKCILYKDLRNFDNIINFIKKYDVNFTVAVNTWYKKLMIHQDFNLIKSQQYKANLAGGEYVPLSTKSMWKEKTRHSLYSAYGLTETCSLSIISPLDESNFDDSIGIAIPNTEVCLIDKNDNVILEDNIIGEILIKGEHITNAYYMNEIETKHAFYNNWFKTGDLAIKVDKTFYKIIDRKKDMISVSGNKVYPNEIEEALFGLDGVLDVAIVGKISDKTGEEVVAFIVLDNNKISIEYIKSFCNEKFTNFKVPKQYIVLTELPKTPIGKTNRKELRTQINI